MTDLRYAFRTLLRQPAFTLVAILTLALGIGANTAIFSVVHGVLLRPLPYPDADRVAQLWSTGPGSARDIHTPGDYMDIRRAVRSLSAVAGYRQDAVTIALPDGQPVRVAGAHVTARFFEVLGMRAALGRHFSESADGRSAEPAVVLSDTVWRQQFGAAMDVVGRRAQLNGVSHTVVGVMPRGFDYPENVRLWVLSPREVPPPPLDVDGELLEARDVRYFDAIARLAPGVSLDAAQAELGTIADDIARRFPSTRGRGLRLEPLHERIVGDVRVALLVLLGAVGVVLLIACANVSSLLLARATGRQREMAVRSALGAGRRRLVRQLVVESLVLGAAGGVAGLVAGAWAIELLVSRLPEGTPRVDLIALDLTVAAAAIAVSLVSALVFGLVPAWQASRTETAQTLRAGDRGSTGDRGRARTRGVLVVSQVALTLVLLVSAALLGNSLLRLQRVDPGFDPQGVTMFSLPLPQGMYPDGARQAAFYQRAVEAIRARPEVRSAAVLFPSPLEGRNASGSFVVDGQPEVTGADRPRASMASVSPDYFRTMGIPLLAGRDFTERDRDPAPDVAIVNATLAERYWPGGQAVGKRLRFGSSGSDWMTIVGVAGDTRNVGLDTPPNPLVYIPYHAFALPFMHIAVRSDAGTAAVTPLVREEIRRLDAEMPLDTVTPLHEVLRNSIADERFRTILLGSFAVMATLLSAVGVYGLIAFSVTQRTREIGIRLALGATAPQVMRPIVREGLVLGGAGVAIGIVAAFAATRLLARFLFGVAPTDPLTFAGVAALLLAIALLASYIPSRKVTRIDPITALRES